LPLPTIPSGNVASATAGGFEVANSCRFNFGDSPKLSKSVSSGSGSTKFTFSCWFKTTTVNSSYGRILWNGDSGGSYETHITLYADGRLAFYWNNGSDGARSWLTNRKLRDPAAWYNLVIIYDSTDGTAGDRVQIWINGIRETSFSESTNPGSNEVINVFKADVLSIGREVTSNDRFSFDGYFAEVCVIDGTDYPATSFGEFDENSPQIWKPIDVSGLTFGTNGFYLDFEDSANLGNDANGGTDLDESNIDATDSATDTPTNNFCTLNPLFKSGAFSSSTGAVVLSQGNCHLAEATHAVTCGTIAVTSGKWYWEVKMNGNDYPFGVLGVEPAGNSSHSYNDSTAYGIYIESSGGNTITAGSWSGTAIYTGNATYMIAIDVDNNKLWCGKDGSWTGDPAAGSGNSVTLGTHTYVPWFHSAGTAGDNSASVNFGGCAAFTISSANQDGDGYGNFEYSVPSGFYSLCTKNLAEYG
jgi:hypothetical protein